MIPGIFLDFWCALALPHLFFWVLKLVAQVMYVRSTVTRYVLYVIPVITHCVMRH